MTANAFHHRNGTARPAAIGSIHARSVRAAHATASAATATRRTAAAIGAAWRGTSTVAPTWVREASMKSAHSHGART